MRHAQRIDGGNDNQNGSGDRSSAPAIAATRPCLDAARPSHLCSIPVVLPLAPWPVTAKGSRF
jgi:hypothetical protein